MPLTWAGAFLLTLAVETPVVSVLLRPYEGRAARRVLLAVLASLATHPAVWFVFPSLALPPWPRFWASEAWAIAAEALLYAAAVRPLPLSRAWLISLAANGASAACGLALSVTR